MQVGLDHSKDGLSGKYQQTLKRIGVIVADLKDQVNTNLLKLNKVHGA